MPADSHRPADHQVSLVGSVSQSHPWIRQPASRVDADVAPLVRSHGVDHVEHHLKHRHTAAEAHATAKLRKTSFSQTTGCGARPGSELTAHFCFLERGLCSAGSVPFSVLNFRECSPENNETLAVGGTTCYSGFFKKLTSD